MRLKRFTILLILLMTVKGLSETTYPINPYGKKTDAAKAVQAAIAFLEECHSSYADSINDKFHADGLYFTDSGTSYVAYSNNGVYIDKGYVFRALDYSNPSHLDSIIELARTLVHETRHADSQSRVYRFGSYAAEGGLLPSWLGFQNGAEIDAYSATIIEMDEWINCRLSMARGWKELGEIEASRHYYCQVGEIIGAKRSYLRDVKRLNTKSGGKFGLAIINPTTKKRVTFDEYIKAMDDLEKKVKGEKATLPPPPPPPKPPKKKKPVTTKKSEAEKKEARKLGGGPEYENELVEPPAGSKPGEVKFEWRGMGKNSGEILELELKNTTDRPGEISLVPGLLLTPPSGSSFQPFVLGLNPAIKIPANGTTKAVVRGYCLDRNVQPPTAGQQVDFQVGVELGKYSQQVRCVWKGLELERSGALHDDLGERHAETVIQRAIWSSQGESPQDLAKDIQDQVKEAGLDRTPEEVAELTQHLTEDVSKVVEASSASTPLKLRCPDIK